MRPAQFFLPRLVCLGCHSLTPESDPLNPFATPERCPRREKTSEPVRHVGRVAKESIPPIVESHRENIFMSESPQTSDVPMIEAEGLSKFYGVFAAARDVTFSIKQGEVAAFIGPNGAGKSTTMKLLTGYLAPSEGVAKIAGFNVATDRLQAAERLGYLPENGPLYSDMTPRSLLTFFGNLRGLPPVELQRRLETIIHTCHLEAVIGKPIGKLSKGYRQRVGMAQALLHDPDVLILDEPTAGLDPNQIREVRKMIRELGQSKTILLSTHILQEVEAMCNRVIFINEGKVVFDGSPEDMVREEHDFDKRFHDLTATV
jgi:ABC-2 type transport system ATP-binding protein